MMVQGALPFEAAEEAINEGMQNMMVHLAELPEATGTLVVRLTVSKTGEVSDLEFLTDTLVARPWDVRENDVSTARARIQVAVVTYFSQITYPESRGTTTITFPIIFS